MSLNDARPAAARLTQLSVVMNRQPAPSSSTVVQRLTANWATSGKDTIITEAGGKQTKVKESNGVVATVAPSDYDSGSVTTAGVRPISQAATRAFGIAFIAGHMLNKHLGGPGDDQKNITAITSAQNSAHHRGLEAAAKTAVRAGRTISYKTLITERADFELAVSGSKKVTATNLASKLSGECKPNDGSPTTTLNLDLGPPNAKKNGVSSESKYSASENNAWMAATGALEGFEDSGKIKSTTDVDELKQYLFELASAGTDASKLYESAKAKGYLS